jgi:hypothetical protein
MDPKRGKMAERAAVEAKAKMWTGAFDMKNWKESIK